jgi:hypothetical protein
MGMTSPFPEPPSPDLARFIVRSRVEIVSALRQIRDQHLLVTLITVMTPGLPSAACWTLPAPTNDRRPDGRCPRRSASPPDQLVMVFGPVAQFTTGRASR